MDRPDKTHDHATENLAVHHNSKDLAELALVSWHFSPIFSFTFVPAEPTGRIFLTGQGSFVYSHVCFLFLALLSLVSVFPKRPQVLAIAVAAGWNGILPHVTFTFYIIRIVLLFDVITLRVWCE